jgi:perosamine synthetase
MLAMKVETRPVFYCAHEMPMYNEPSRYPVSENISSRGISLPSYPALTEAQILRVVDALRSALVPA